MIDSKRKEKANKLKIIEFWLAIIKLVHIIGVFLRYLGFTHPWPILVVHRVPESCYHGYSHGVNFSFSCSCWHKRARCAQLSLPVKISKLLSKVRWGRLEKGKKTRCEPSCWLGFTFMWTLHSFWVFMGTYWPRKKTGRGNSSKCTEPMRDTWGMDSLFGLSSTYSR